MRDEGEPRELWVSDGEPPSTFPNRRAGVLEYPAEPCPSCGAALLRYYVDQFDGHDVKPVRQVSAARCPNGCDTTL